MDGWTIDCALSVDALWMRYKRSWELGVGAECLFFMFIFILFLFDFFLFL